MAKIKPTKPTLKKEPKQPKERRDWKILFLNALSKSPSVAAAANAARVNRSYVYEVRGEDKGFATAWDNAINVSLDLAEDELYRRGVKGYDEPVFYQGEQKSKVRKFSDTLLIFLLKAHRPEKYREMIQQQLTGKDGGPIEIADIEAIRKKRWKDVAPALAALEKSESKDGE